MSLEQIGFYTLSDARALNTSLKTPLQRCELILTDACNFKCPYCRGLKPGLKGSMPFKKASAVVKHWTDERLRNIRFSGGEPTLYKGLANLVAQAKAGGVERIAVSTNGSAPWSAYQELINVGVNDFSISLDGCCSAVGDRMAGGIPGAWDTVVENIRRISAKTYCTLGMVFTEQNIDHCVDAVAFAESLGVADIRVIPSAQYNQALIQLAELGDAFLDKHPILKYRIKNIQNKRPVRGLNSGDPCKCWLALDDMAIAGDYHFPCIIHLREGGASIGKVGPNMRRERLEWIQRHVPSEDPICKKNCLDVCSDYNHCAARTHSFDGLDLNVELPSNYTKCPDCGNVEIEHGQAFSTHRKPPSYDEVYCDECGWGFNVHTGHTKMPVRGYG